MIERHPINQNNIESNWLVSEDNAMFSRESRVGGCNASYRVQGLSRSEILKMSTSFLCKVPVHSTKANSDVESFKSQLFQLFNRGNFYGHFQCKLQGRLLYQYFIFCILKSPKAWFELYTVIVWFNNRTELFLFSSI